MSEDNTVIDNNYSSIEQNDGNNESSDVEVSQIYSLLHLMRISNEFAIMKDSMEMFPLPGNYEMPQDHLLYPPWISVEYAVQAFGRGRVTDFVVSLSVNAEYNKLKIRDLVINGVDELTKLSLENEPLWQYDPKKETEVLNSVEYTRRFSILKQTLEEVIRLITVDAPLNVANLGGTSEPLGEQGARAAHIEASREILCVQMPPITIVNIMMDVKLWSFVFSDILSRALVLGILEPGALGTLDGALQVMVAEYHAPSPLVSTRESCFARYCKVLASNMWLIVDVSLEDLIPNPLMNCKRKPSGCLIEGLPDGRTKVVWVEHVQCNNQKVHPMYKPLVDTEIIFGAKRWVDSLVRQCERLHLVIQQTTSALLPGNNGAMVVEGLLRLSDRIRRTFSGAVSASKAQTWKPIPVDGAEDILVRSQEIEYEEASVLTVTYSFWLPVKPWKVFDFLRDERNRLMWDIFADGHTAEEAFHIHSALTLDSTLSVIKMVDGDNRVSTMMLQESYGSFSGYYITYAAMDESVLKDLLEGGSTDSVGLLPSGFSILPDRPKQQEENFGTVLNLGFQLFDRSARANFIPGDSVEALYKLVLDTVTLLRNAILRLP